MGNQCWRTDNSTGVGVMGYGNRALGTRSRRQETGKQLESSSHTSASGLRSPDSETSSPVSGFPSPIILIVEDNADLRQYMSTNMDNHYHIIEAENGEHGLAKATRRGAFAIRFYRAL